MKEPEGDKTQYGRMALRMVIPEEKDLKVCVVGPKASGKTSITRALADWDPKSACYAPTAGVRIQEVERKIPNSVHTWAVELWDCSGDSRFQDCWSAMAKDAQGLFIVYNADAAENNQKELERWYKAFAVPNNLPDTACQVFGLTENVNLLNASPARLEGKLRNTCHQYTSLDQEQSRDQLFHALDFILASISSGRPQML